MYNTHTKGVFGLDHGVLFEIFNRNTQICFPPQDLMSSYYKDYVQKILKKKSNKIRYQDWHFQNKSIDGFLSSFQLVDVFGWC